MNYLSPLFNDQTFTANGDPAVGYKINTYAAGTSTPIATYTTQSGSTEQSNPIVLNARGAPDDVIWLGEGLSYKFVLTDSNDAVIDTFDNIQGINDTSVSGSEWIASGFTPTYIGATSFSLVGDKTGDFLVGRRIRTTNTGGTTYSLITVASYSSGTGLTTITVTNDSGTLDAGLSAVDLAILTPTNPSLPNSSAARTALGVAASGGITSSGLTMATARILGRTTASTGAVEEISTSADLTLSGGSLSLARPLTSGTAVTLTAVTSGDFTGIPSWAKKITIMYAGVSYNANANPMIQIGNGSVVTTGYLSAAGEYVPTASHTSSTAGFIQTGSTGGVGAAANAIHGIATLVNLDGDTWVFSSTIASTGTANTATGSGFITLGGDLDRVRITTAAGTSTFDAGVVNIMYE